MKYNRKGKFAPSRDTIRSCCMLIWSINDRICFVHWFSDSTCQKTIDMGLLALRTATSRKCFNKETVRSLENIHKVLIFSKKQTVSKCTTVVVLKASEKMELSSKLIFYQFDFDLVWQFLKYSSRLEEQNSNEDFQDNLWASNFAKFWVFRQ